MRIPINLAREPFRRDRPILIASALVGVLLLGTLALLTVMAIADRREADDTQVALNRVNSQLQRIHAEQAKIDNAMRQPGNAEVLDRSAFLNSLIYRKAISWTKIFADLEKVMPPNVRVIAIRPQISGRNRVFLDMTVAADAPEQMTGLVSKLEGSDIFGSTVVSSITPPSQSDPFYRYRLSVNYAQKL